MSHSSLENKIKQKIAQVNTANILIPSALTLKELPRGLASYIDHTLLKPETTYAQLQQLCDDALTYRFCSVCVQPSCVPFCLERLHGSPIKVCAVAGFPHGATLPAVKAYEAAELVKLGVAEIDMVLNVGRLKDGDYRLVFEDIAGVADAAHEGGALLKVIIETGLLTHAEKVAASLIVQEAGADFVKTATGFNGGGATLEDVALMRWTVGPPMGVKAAGGVRTAQDALAMIAAGATRIGTSGGVRIMQEANGMVSSPTLSQANVPAKGDKGDSY